jgi:hypothetical protein
LPTPSHIVPQILESLLVAANRGLRLPVVYNTSGYNRLETPRWLDGIAHRFGNPGSHDNGIDPMNRNIKGEPL